MKRLLWVSTVALHLFFFWTSVVYWALERSGSFHFLEFSSCLALRKSAEADHTSTTPTQTGDYDVSNHFCYWHILCNRESAFYGFLKFSLTVNRTNRLRKLSCYEICQNPPSKSSCIRYMLASDPPTCRLSRPRIWCYWCLYPGISVAQICVSGGQDCWIHRRTTSPHGIFTLYHLRDPAN